MKRFILGDIHGELESLKQVFELAKFNFKKDELIQIGDICDRGDSSYECVEFLKKCKKLILIQGNHDIWLKDAIDRDPDPNWFYNGGISTLGSYRKNNKDIKFHQIFYNYQVPYYVDKNNNCFVHGGFQKEKPINDQPGWFLAWDRELVNQMMSCKSGKLKTADKFNKIFIGHTPTIYWSEDEKKSKAGIITNPGRHPITTPIKRGGVINIDTGSGKGGKLSLMDIETEEYWQSDLQKRNGYE